MAPAPKPRDRWRNAKRRVLRRLADRTTRRRLLLVFVTLVAIGSLAAVKGLIGYYVFSSRTTRFEVALGIAALVAAVFALGERKVASALEARFNRDTRKHREALAQLRDELALVPDRAQLTRQLVTRFDELFGTTGTALYLDDGEAYAVAAWSGPQEPQPLPYDDAAVVALRAQHAPYAPPEDGSALATPLAWPLRSRGHLIGILAAGEHDYLESFDALEIEAVEAVADAAAANLALIDPALTVHLVRTPNNLPPAPGTFVGRARELAECREILAQARILTLTGFGGAGKSRLAHKLAEEALASRRGGVWWVEVADVADDAHLHAAVAAALGAKETDGGPISAAALARRCGDGGTLIVLDTCEHLRSACARLAADILRENARVAVLATSQSPLGVPGERDYAVPPLTLPETDDDAEWERSDAVRLFVERARLVVPGFAPGPAERADVIAIVRELDGIPLAIELAAARAKLLSLAAIREHLVESLRILAGGDHADARHETMRASLAWSYDPLAEGEQRLLRRLSVFAGGFTLEAAAAVAAGGGDALDALDPIGRLVEASLLLVARRGDDEPRYHIPETLRQFLAERLGLDADAGEIRARHARYYVALAERETGALHGGDMHHALARLDHESANLAAAHAWCMRQPGGGDAALALAHALAPYWRDRGLLSRGRDRTEEALRHPGAAAGALRAEVLLDLAELSRLAGDASEAMALCTQAESAAKSLAADELACRALAQRALALSQDGAHEEARLGLEEAVAHARRLGNATLLRSVLDDLGEVLGGAGRWQEAAAAVDESLALARRGDDAAALHVALRDAARVAVERNDLARARSLMREAIDLALSSHSHVDGEADLEVAAALALAVADHARAARFAGAAEAAAASIGRAQPVGGNGGAAAHAQAQRAALGDVEYAVAREGGHRLKLAAALDEARAWLAG